MMVLIYMVVKKILPNLNTVHKHLCLHDPIIKYLTEN